MTTNEFEQTWRYRATWGTKTHIYHSFEHSDSPYANDYEEWGYERVPAEFECVMSLRDFLFSRQKNGNGVMVSPNVLELYSTGLVVTMGWGSDLDTFWQQYSLKLGLRRYMRPKRLLSAT